MDAPSPRHILELAQAPEVRWLGTGVVRYGCLTFDQVHHYGPFPYQEYGPKTRRDLIHGDVARLVDAGYFSTVKLPVIRLKHHGDEPLFTYRRYDPEPDFNELHRRISDRRPESVTCEPTKILTFGEKTLELVSPDSFNTKAHDSPFKSHRCVLAYHTQHPLLTRLQHEQAKRSSPEYEETEKVPTGVEADEFQFVDKLVNEVDLCLHITTCRQLDPREWHIDSWSLSRTIEHAPSDPLAYNRPDSTRSCDYFAWERDDPWGETDGVHRRDVERMSEEWSRVSPWIAAPRTAYVIAQGRDASELKRLHESIMLENHWRTWHCVYLNDGYELW